jgi:23S rRNA (guanosine2251-2'-O)-methyltransferase
LIPGFHGVREALSGQTVIREIWVAKGKKTPRKGEILQIAKAKNIPVVIKENEELSRLFPDISHQGIAALVEEFSYRELSSITENRSKKPSLLIALDHITDEGNMGAIIRTAVFFGVHGLIIPKDRSAGVTANVVKRSSGAWIHLPIVRVVNLGRALDVLEKKGFWIIGTSGKGRELIYDFDWDRDVVLVLGNEQKGLSQSAQKRCQEIVGIPVTGPVESLNVAVACGVILSEIIRQRKAGNPESQEA